MAKTKYEDLITEELTIEVGTAATKHVGSDSYPYYISEVLPNGVYGVYAADYTFDNAHPYYAGYAVIQPFDKTNAKTKTDFYLKRCYGNWWKVDKNGSRISRFTDRYQHFSIGHAIAYLNPSF